MKNEEIRDYIKKETEQISVPDSLTPESVKEKLAPVRQYSRRKRQRIRTAVAAASCLIILLAAGVTILPRTFREDSSRREDTQSTVAEEQPTADVRYEELCQWINDYNGDIPEYDTNDSYGGRKDVLEEAEAEDEVAVSNKKEASSSSAGREGEDYSETDTQVENVMEGDIVKTDGRYIYTLRDNVYGFDVVIYRVEGESVKNTAKVTKISIEDQNYSEMYLENDQLILIGTLWSPSEEDGSGQESETRITVYDITDRESPKKAYDLAQSGDYNTSRVSDGYLYTFSDLQVEGSDFTPDDPEQFIPHAGKDLIPEENLYPLNRSAGNRYMVMTSLELGGEGEESFTDQKQFTGSAAIFGDSPVYYMSNDNIYIAMPTDARSGNTRTSLLKYHYQDGKFKKIASRQIRGRIANSYYLHEYEGNLAFVYTRLKESGTTNGLCTLDENLEPLGEIASLGINETIYSSYYIENMAYFVTYRETDPVFAVDISNPKKPALKAKLKLPGFSSYLHSFGDELLLGIGEDEGKYDECVKLSLFSIRNPEKLKETVKKKLSDGSMSIADENHKAVFVDEERQLIGLGIGSYYSVDKVHYVLYQYKNGKLKELHRQKGLSGLSTVRGLRIGDYFYIVDTEEGRISSFHL